MAASGFASSSLVPSRSSDYGFSRAPAFRSSLLPLPSALRSFSFDFSPSSSRFISLLSISPSRSLKRTAILALDPDFYKIPYAEGIPVGSRMKIWNLPQNCDKDELKEWFESINITVEKIEFTDDPELNAAGINGFVEMSTKHEACMAVAQLDGRKFKGRCIRFDFVEKRPHEREIGGRRNRPSYSSSSSSYPSSLVNDFKPTGRRGGSSSNPSYATGTASRPGNVSRTSSYGTNTESRPSTVSSSPSYATSPSTASSIPSVAPTNDSPPSAPASPPSYAPTIESPPSAPSSSPSYAGAPSSSPNYAGAPSSSPSYAGAPSSSPSYVGAPSSSPSYAGVPSGSPSYASAPTSAPSYASAPSGAPGYGPSSDAPRSYAPPSYAPPSYAGRPYGSPSSSSKVFVGNLPWSVDDAALERIFGVHGTIYEAKVMRDRESGRSRGFGFVLFSSHEEMQAAISALDGSYVEGRPIKVNEAASRY